MQSDTDEKPGIEGFPRSGGTRREAAMNNDASGRVADELRGRCLWQSEERFHALFESMTEGFAFHEIVCDEAGKPCDLRYLAVNPAFERHTGLKAQEILGRTSLELFPDADPVWIERYGKVALTGEPARFEAWFGPLGRWFEVSAFRSEPGRFGTVLTDITARKRGEEQMAWLASFPERNANPIAEIEPLAGVPSRSEEHTSELQSLR